jgi:serine/threonine protein kinase
VIRRRAVWQTKFQEEEVWYYLHQTAEGLAALHAAGVYHGTLRVHTSSIHSIKTSLSIRREYNR